MSKTARVTFPYKAEQEDELSLEVGDIVTNIVDVDVGWCEGELNGKKGMFPNNFVEEIVAASSDSNPDSVAGKKAKVTFDYEAENQDELSLKLNDIVDVLGEEEPGWWKGQIANGKVGLFPSNFVELIDEKDAAEPKDMPVETQRKHSGEGALPAKEPPSSENVDGFFDEEEPEKKRHPSVGASAKKLPGGGMGFGNLINPNILAEKKLKKVHYDVKGEKKAKPEEKSSITSAEQSKSSTVKTKAPALSAKSRPAPPVPLSSPAKKPPSERAKVTFPYEPENPDELHLVEGDIITVLNKDIAESEGWWEGEVNGKVGVFPNNFVELLPAEEEDTSVKDKKGVSVLPAANLDEVKQSPKMHKKPAPSLPTKDESDSDVSSEPPHLPGRRPEKPVQVTPKEPHHIPAEVTRPAPGKKPMAPQKPSLPPKKPLPLKTKKPDITGKKPENSNVKEPLQDQEVSKPADKKLATPEIKTTAEAPVSFDEVPQTETLNHLTANRAKVPQKRPPSKEGRLTDSARLSAGDIDEHVAETHKQPPGRPKEPPKEPAWKREVREAREKKQAHDEKAAPPLIASKSDAVEKRKSLHKDEAQEQAPPVQKVEPFTTTSTGEVERLRKEVSELREMVLNLEKKHNESIKKLEEKLLREIEMLTNDFDEEKKQNAAQQSALKIELDRIKRRQSRFSLEDTQ